MSVRAAVVGTIAVLALSAAGARTSAGAASGPRTFVGQVSGGEQFIAVVASRGTGEATAYLCDGRRISTWFFGHASGNTLDLTSGTGRRLRATLARGRVSGTVELPSGGTRSFRVRRATGVAGIYLVNRSLDRVRGFSSRRAKLAATVARASGGRFAIHGTVTPRGGSAVALQGTGRFLGSLKRSATWIVLGDGRVHGGTPTNTTGGGNCSIWSKIKQIMTGVFCGFFRD
jgi:hypothetical protein